MASPSSRWLVIIGTVILDQPASHQWSVEKLSLIVEYNIQQEEGQAENDAIIEALQNPAPSFHPRPQLAPTVANTDLDCHEARQMLNFSVYDQMDNDAFLDAGDPYSLTDFEMKNRLQSDLEQWQFKILTGQDRDELFQEDVSERDMIDSILKQMRKFLLNPQSNYTLQRSLRQRWMRSSSRTCR